MATVLPHGGPHIATRWFVWQPDALYVTTRVGDTTWEALEHDARISLVIDRGRLVHEDRRGSVDEAKIARYLSV